MTRGYFPSTHRFCSEEAVQYRRNHRSQTLTLRRALFNSNRAPEDQHIGMQSWWAEGERSLQRT